MSNDNFRWYLEVSAKQLQSLLPAERAQLGYELFSEPEHAANRLLTIVGNAEALAGSLISWRNASAGGIEQASRPRTRCNKMIAALLAEDGIEPASIFGDDVWEKFSYAVDYAEVVRHECVPLKHEYCVQLMSACATVLGTLMTRYGIPQPQSTQGTSTEATNTTGKTTNSGDDKAPLEVVQMLKEMFGWTERMTGLLISAGYVGFLAVWAHMNEKMTDATSLAVALLFVSSLSCFAFWHAFNVLRFNKASVIFERNSKIPGNYQAAVETFFTQVRNPHSPFEKFWVTRVLPSTVATAMLGAILMASAFIHGLLVVVGCDLPICKPVS